MILYSKPEFSPPAPCPYLPDRTLVYSFFFADSLSGAELSWFLSRGWRKFGHYFFRPACPGCRACTPLRVPVRRFKPSRGQKRVLRRCNHINVSFGPVRYEKELFDLYHSHSRVRFAQESTFDEFIANLHSAPCPNLLARYEYDGRLLGAGARRLLLLETRQSAPRRAPLRRLRRHPDARIFVPWNGDFLFFRMISRGIRRR